ncbi:hypothetical protein [uncultured Tyzzerella sp.]|uniref:hypothetical protein n=1 Tax=uncultured Tyzzerella sp. TaxID=2321398 RepID=UPI0029420E60|nr:hypothetical protein [uncultured Tyzzerella sp.]
MKNILKNFSKKAILFYSFLVSILFINTNFVFADDLINNNITKGFQKMLQDGLNLLMLLSSGVALVTVGIQLFKKHYTGDEMESKQCNKKILTIIIAWIALMSISVVFKIIGNYFGVKGA